MMNPPPAHGAKFEEAIKVTPLGSNRYSAFLQDDWCIGTVPHGGYISAILYRLALVHFENTHPTLYKEPATPISMQLTFLRRTTAGPAILSVQDMKIGARTSTIQVSLLQDQDQDTDKEKLEIKISGYITVSPPSAETGVSLRTDWTLLPRPSQGSGGEGEVDFTSLVRTGRDGDWVRVNQAFAEFRRATTQVEVFGPESGGRNGIVDQWARLRPGGGSSEVMRWSNEGVAFLVDVFPVALDGFGSASSSSSSSSSSVSSGDAKFWFPTVTLNIDFKKRLPPSGTEWLYSRVVTTTVRDGRTDLGVTVLDEAGEVVALSTQVGLVLSASRNIGRRARI